MIFDVDGAFYELHAMIVQFICNLFHLLTLECETTVLRLLLRLRFAYELLEIMNFLRQILLDVDALGLGHLQHGIPLRVQDLHFLLAEIKLLARLRYFLLELHKVGVERPVILGALTRETSVSRHDLLTGGSHKRLLLASYKQCKRVRALNLIGRARPPIWLIKLTSGILSEHTTLALIQTIVERVIHKRITYRMKSIVSIFSFYCLLSFVTRPLSF
jgi:hypothetical protein